jgi:hypothetical protein
MEKRASCDPPSRGRREKVGGFRRFSNCAPLAASAWSAGRAMTNPGEQVLAPVSPHHGTGAEFCCLINAAGEAGRSGQAPGQQTPDPRIVFLRRAEALLELFYSCDLTLDEAIDGLFEAIEQLREIMDDAA